MKFLDYISGVGGKVSSLISKLTSRMDKRECYTKLKSYTTTEMNAIPSPEVGYLVYNTTTTSVYVYKIVGWTAV